MTWSEEERKKVQLFLLLLLARPVLFSQKWQNNFALGDSILLAREREREREKERELDDLGVLQPEKEGRNAEKERIANPLGHFLDTFTRTTI